MIDLQFPSGPFFWERCRKINIHKSPLKNTVVFWNWERDFSAAAPSSLRLRLPRKRKTQETRHLTWHRTLPNACLKKRFQFCTELIGTRGTIPGWFRSPRVQTQTWNLKVLTLGRGAGSNFGSLNRTKKYSGKFSNKWLRKQTHCPPESEKIPWQSFVIHPWAFPPNTLDVRWSPCDVLPDVEHPDVSVFPSSTFLFIPNTDQCYMAANVAAARLPPCEPASHEKRNSHHRFLSGPDHKQRHTTQTSQRMPTTPTSNKATMRQKKNAKISTTEGKSQKVACKYISQQFCANICGIVHNTKSDKFQHFPIIFWVHTCIYGHLSLQGDDLVSASSIGGLGPCVTSDISVQLTESIAVSSTGDERVSAFFMTWSSGLHISCVFTGQSPMKFN